MRNYGVTTMTFDQLELFGDQEKTEVYQSPIIHEMIKVFGYGPINKRCQECSHLSYVEPKAGHIFHKCSMRKLDQKHHERWRACGMFTEK